MNKKLTIASAILAASAAFAFDTWLGDAPQVETGIGNDTNTYGYWFSYGDDGDGGESKVVWPVELGNEYSATAMDPVVEHCHGICGTAALAKGSLTYSSIASIEMGLPPPGRLELRPKLLLKLAPSTVKLAVRPSAPAKLMPLPP